MKPHTILVVEDHQGFASALLRILESKQGFDLLPVAANAEAALEALASLDGKVDLVLVDISLPGMSGIELVGQLRSKYPDLRCAVLSGHISPQHVQRALAAGANGYIVKDDAEGLLEGIQQVLNGQVYISHSAGGQ